MIGGNLEYLMSSLPNLSFEHSSESRKQVFSVMEKYAGTKEEKTDLIVILNSEAEKFLSAQKYDLFRNVNLDDIYKTLFQHSSCKLLSAYSKYTFFLKKEIMQLRLARKDPKNGAPPKEQEVLIRPGTPLQAEIQVMKYQWDKLEELSVGHYADLEDLICYKLKLMIMLRWWSFDSDRGFEIFTQKTKGAQNG